MHERTPSFDERVAVVSQAMQGQADVATAPDLRRENLGQVRRSALLLEDDPTLLALLEMHLQALELRTLRASTIREARELLAENEIQLGLFDIQLPDGSGLELCAELDENPRWMGLPVVILSSSRDSDVVRRTRSAGARFFLSKPYDPNVLLAVIELALGEGI